MKDEESKGGWLKLYQSFLRWEWYTDVNTKTVFLHCLLTANWKENRFMGVVIPVGSLVTSYPSLAKNTGLTVQMCRTAVKKLISTGEITVKKYPKFSVYTVVKWKDFQGEQQSTQQSSNSQATVKQQHYKNIRNKDKKTIYMADQRTYDYEELQKRLANK